MYFHSVAVGFPEVVSAVNYCDHQPFDLLTCWLTPVSAGWHSATEGSSAVNQSYGIVHRPKVDRVSPVTVGAHSCIAILNV